MTNETTQKQEINPEVRRGFLEGQLKGLNAKLRSVSTREADLPEIQSKIEEIVNEINGMPSTEKSSEETYQEALEKVTEYLSQPLNEHLYYLAEDNKFARYLPQSLAWKFITKEGLKGSCSLIRSESRFQILQDVLEKAGRTFTTKAYNDPAKGSIKDEVLNMMFMDHWLKPKFERTENTKWFDYLLLSIGNYKEENIQHIMQVIGWKYTHPGEWNMPALCLYGRGGSGKNMLASTLMQVIFGTHQQLTTNFKKLERFDGILAGKMAVMFDEHPNKEDQSVLKGIVGNPELEVELKNVNTFKISNLALYFLATNDSNGPIRIENNGSERRWSMIHSTNDLVSVVAKEESVSKDEAFQMLKKADKAVFRNPDEVACFLGACIEEANKLESVPMALHGEDYAKLKEVQKDATDEVLEELFVEYKGFQFITLQTLYELYKARNKAVNPSASPMAVQRFTGRVMEFLGNHKTAQHIVKSETRFVVKVNGKPIKATIFYSTNAFKEFDNKQTEKTQEYMSMAYLLPNENQAKLAQIAYEFLKDDR